MVDNKVFFFDMDGTLLPHGTNQKISDCDVAALNRLEELGYDVVLNTGKSLSMCENELKLFNFISLITSNGQSVICDGKTIYDGVFTRDDINYWISYAKDNNLQIGFQTDDKQMILNYGEVIKYRELCFGNLNIDLPEIIDELDDDVKVLQIWLLGDVNKEDLREDFDYFKWHQSAYDVQLKGISKGSGMKHVLNHFNYEKATTYAFGDSFNDLPMFELADVSVALGNANDVVKKYADFTTTSVSESGVSQFLKENKLI